MKQLTVLLSLFGFTLLSSCDWRQSAASRQFDHAAQDLPFAQPVVRMAEALPDALPISNPDPQTVAGATKES